MTRPLTILLLSALCAWGQVFTDDFETGDAAGWTAAYQTGSGVVLSVTTNQSYSGLYSARVTIRSGDDGTAFLESSFTGTAGPVYCRVAFYLPANFTLTGADTAFVFFGPASLVNGLLDKIALKRLGSGNLVLSSSKTGDGATAVTLGAWHCVETLYQAGAGNGVAAFWLDGTLQQTNDTLTLPYWVDSLNLGYRENSWLAGTNISGTIYFDNASVATNYTGPLASTMQVCAPDFRGRAGASPFVVLSGYAATDTLDVFWQKAGTSNHVYSAHPIPSGAFHFPVQMTNLGIANWTLVSEWRNSGGTLKATNATAFAKTYAAESRLTLDSDNNLLLDGRKFFPVTEFGAAPEDIPFWATNRYVNTFFGQNWWLPSKANLSNYLDLVAANSMSMFIPLNVGGGGMTLAEATNYVTAFSWSTNVLGYVWCDEPDYNGLAYADVQSWYAACKALDPARLTQLNFMGTSFSGTGAEQAVGKAWSYPRQVADLYGFDMYPIYNTNLTFAQIHQAAVNLDKFNKGVLPFFGFVQTCNGDVGYPQPTAAQLKMMAWLLVVGGAKGVQWYPFGGTTSAECYAAMAQFVTDTSNLTEIVLAPAHSIAVAGSGIYGTGRTLLGNNYMIAVNTTSNNVAATLTDGACTVNRMFAAYEVAVLSNYFTLTLTGPWTLTGAGWRIGQ